MTKLYLLKIITTRGIQNLRIVNPQPKDELSQLPTFKIICIEPHAFIKYRRPTFVNLPDFTSKFCHPPTYSKSDLKNGLLDLGSTGPSMTK